MHVVIEPLKVHRTLAGNGVWLTVTGYNGVKEQRACNMGIAVTVLECWLCEMTFLKEKSDEVK